MNFFLSKAPSKEDLRAMQQRLQTRLDDLATTVEIFKGLELPDFVRETEFVALKGEGSYPWIGGDLVSTDGVVKPEDDYKAMTNEYKVDFSTSKFQESPRDHRRENSSK